MSLWIRDPYRLIADQCNLTTVLYSGSVFRSTSSVPSPRSVLEFPAPGESPIRKKEDQSAAASPPLPTTKTTTTTSSFLILVVDPSTNEFEFVQVQHNIFSETTINEVILEIIPRSAKDHTLANIPYQAICDYHGKMFNRATKLSDIVKVASKRSISIEEKQQVILVAVPSSSTPKDSTKLAQKILCHPGIIKMVSTHEKVVSFDASIEKSNYEFAGCHLNDIRPTFPPSLSFSLSLSLSLSFAIYHRCRS